jgi:hypothetical protein
MVAGVEEIGVIASGSEAIQSGAPELDCFVASLLAMTRNYSAATWCRCKSGTTLARSPEGAISAWFSGTAIQFSP